MRYHVLHFTVCDGWVNTWLVNDQPETFATCEEAQAEIDAFLVELEADVATGDLPPDHGYSADEFRIEAIDDSTNESTTDANLNL